MSLSLACALLATTSSAFAQLAPALEDCTTTISSIADATNASTCATVNINGFTVPAGEGFTLNLADGATVNLLGDVLFGNKSWEGPLFTIREQLHYLSLNGNGFIFDGGGPFYWDGLGGNGGILKPGPMMKIKMSGSFNNLKVVNSPRHVFSVSNGQRPLTISGCTVDDSQGFQPNNQSNGTAAGHNTDGFDISSSNVLFTGNTVISQDDCLAINKGSNITFTNNTCSGGHGISVGSISSDASVSNIAITDNTIINNDQALRIKTKASAVNGSVANITYSGNTGTGMRRFGIIIDQGYPKTLGKPGTGVIISDVNFIGEMNNITVNDKAVRVAVNCGEGACQGTWNWTSLVVTGGQKSNISGFDGITGGSF
ncbi:uncharacterized protein FOMMEDRAFT_84384 [Fomitiporia mediterranea MF3/22]|uniref:uncharacterized protein n=1 Tax=Fomitiporia mediterranea (strain MF3/22) TaxID=694068 RepID=UPI00044084E7|nr:uncharacterized protein FOMMEDRAFT_84384 [Fomitiporia mediterranea MF3/22]EJD03056.1 hypothetical protein FOMMEDRAFT_84384 [Fomitiporia mediterranea MF3/22]